MILINIDHIDHWLANFVEHQRAVLQSGRTNVRLSWLPTGKLYACIHGHLQVIGPECLCPLWAWASVSGR